MDAMDQKEKEVIIKLWDMYKNYTHMWDKKNINYSNKLMRQDSLNKLLEIYKNFNPGATTDTLKSKISNMRTYFFREAKEVKRNSQYVPRVWYYDYMKFLIEETSESGQRSSETSNKLEKEDILEKESDESEDTIPVPLKKVRKTVKEGQGDRWEILGQLYATDLQNLDDEQLTIVYKLISDVIYNGKFRNLTVNSSINLGQK